MASYGGEDNRTEPDNYAIADALQGAAFFNCANRLMLSLGEPQWQVGG